MYLRDEWEDGFNVGLFTTSKGLTCGLWVYNIFVFSAYLKERRVLHKQKD